MLNAEFTAIEGLTMMRPESKGLCHQTVNLDFGLDLLVVVV
jgi:hypothetical protein